MTTPATDPQEVAKFNAHAEAWWNPDGPFKPLHRFNPVRLDFVKSCVAQHFARNLHQPQPFSGLRLLDIGCGGGLVSEPLARAGADVVGIDPAIRNIQVAKHHAHEQGLSIDYRATTAETLRDAHEQFDVVLALEVIEHVPDAAAFVKLVARLCKPTGIIVMATINRTPQSLLLAKLGAEYVLRWLPIGTHDWHKFIRPDELQQWAGDAGWVAAHNTGVCFSPLRWQWRLSDDMMVNYMMSFCHQSAATAKTTES